MLFNSKCSSFGSCSGVCLSYLSGRVCSHSGAVHIHWLLVECSFGLSFLFLG